MRTWRTEYELLGCLTSTCMYKLGAVVHMEQLNVETVLTILSVVVQKASLDIKE